ncbi:hypothetical protein IVB18_38995 [Bradyrhizobium sp. 186]|uniref:LysR substrate-binding domain-containing protein n=1 Tax=Bradyrhizobium sp. 186 TaxID=2782654 RepID=UPI00206AF117|nr:LysR substrate-binding domain-containing protein [Bradyrhizobium sp. 186]UPK34089.1 hypothetical protein IVB18_38995 [Bradyrhizobium sp. 186]
MSWRTTRRQVWVKESADELVYRRVITEPFVVIFPSDHRLAVRDAVELREIVGETFIIPSKTAPTSRVVIEDYLKRSGLDIIPGHEVDNITHAVSMIASTGAVALLPAYPSNLLPWSVTSRPLEGDPTELHLCLSACSLWCPGSVNWPLFLHLAVAHRFSCIWR